MYIPIPHILREVLLPAAPSQREPTTVATVTATTIPTTLSTSIHSQKPYNNPDDKTQSPYHGNLIVPAFHTVAPHPFLTTPSHTPHWHVLLSQPDPIPLLRRAQSPRAQNATIIAVTVVCVTLFLAAFFWFIWKYHESIRIHYRGPRGGGWSGMSIRSVSFSRKSSKASSSEAGG